MAGTFSFRDVSSSRAGAAERLFQSFQQQRALVVENELKDKDKLQERQHVNGAGPATTTVSTAAATEPLDCKAVPDPATPFIPGSFVEAQKTTADASSFASLTDATTSITSLAGTASTSTEPTAEDFRQTLDTLAAQAIGPNFVRVKPSQKGNPVLKHIKKVPWQYCEQVPDFIVGKTTCVLYLSVKYHNLHETYIDRRIRELGRIYRLRILLLYVDMADSEATVIELARICVANDLTLILAWSEKEAGRYIEAFKSLEHKPADALRHQAPADFMSQMEAALTSIRTVNKSDNVTLISTFGSFHGIAKASADELALCSGFGENKVNRLMLVLDQPFVNPERKRPSKFRLEDNVAPAEKRDKSDREEAEERQEKGEDQQMEAEEDKALARAMRLTQAEMMAEGEQVLLVEDDEEDEGDM